MDALLAQWPVLTVLFLGALARSALGFGDALIAMPLLALVLEMRWRRRWSRSARRRSPAVLRFRTVW